ncbi:hypothetical protein [Sphaerimonospora thailandensis]|uniref:hypothetical protein n=1 Tax=Sphaerimonospora thailandensis TaxID=795644 RepID=UPI001EF1C325|nr:hypothetical protein [Sphaerimonospora thailandensis]
MIALISYYADLAIGLVLAFLLLSLLVSGINEGIVRLLAIRSKFLWAYLRDTLDGAERPDGEARPARLLDRLLRAFKGLGRRLRAPLMELLPPPAQGRSRLPATVLGVFARLPFGRDPRPPFTPGPAPADGERAGRSPADLLHERLREIDHVKRGRTTIADIPPVRFAVAVMEIATEHGGIEALMRDLDRMKSPIYRPLKAVWDRVEHDVESFRRGVGEWFDGEMERLSILYRRYVRWVVAALGIAVTLLFGMDALEYGKNLLRDNAYRSEVSAFAQSGPVALAPIRQECGPGQDTYTCVTDVLSTPAFVKIFANAPVGVTMGDGGDSPSWAWNWDAWWQRLSTPGHWPGFLITAVALLFGAPFWWDMLRRVAGLRSRAGGTAGPTGKQGSVSPR